MRHRKGGIKTLGRVKAQREALMRNLADSLILHGKIETTEVKAKELRKVVEPLITKAKKGGIAQQRQIRTFLYTDQAVNKLMNDLAPKFQDRQGGYTRVTKIGRRQNDGAAMATIEFVD